MVVGSLNMDMVVRVKSMPLPGETVYGGGLTYLPGGKGANQAAAVAKLGGDTAMIGCVGDDAFGAKLSNELKAMNVDESGISRVIGVTTGLAVIYVDDGGGNSIVVVPGANHTCDTARIQLHEDMIAHCDYVLLQMEIPQSTVYNTIRLAKTMGKTVILNPAPAPTFIPEDILRLVDYLTPNEHEAVTLAGGDAAMRPEEAACILNGKGAGKVVVTLGGKGALLSADGTCTYFPAREVRAVDTTAAGDCFNGAFAVALSEGMDEARAIAFANRAASIAVTRAGTQNSMPAREEVDEISEIWNEK